MNLKLTLLACLLAVAQSRFIERIVNGYDAQPGQFPHQVSVQWGWPPFVEFQHFCGGSILNERWILTAAHCLDQYTEFGYLAIKAGKHNLNQQENSEQLVYVESYYQHENYIPSNDPNPNDIALIKVSEPLQLNERVAAIALPEKNMEHRGEAAMSGWGSTAADPENPVSPTTLQATTMPIIDSNECRQAIANVAQEGRVEIPDMVKETHVCVKPLIGGVSACVVAQAVGSASIWGYASTDNQSALISLVFKEHSVKYSQKIQRDSGDSGGPLTYINQNGQSELIGVASFVLTPCGRVGAPTAYIKTSPFVDWITNTMRNY